VYLYLRSITNRILSLNVLDPLIGKNEALKVITVLNWPNKDTFPPQYTPLSQHSRRFESNSEHTDY
jgi:hypothetical protein